MALTHSARGRTVARFTAQPRYMRALFSILLVGLTISARSGWAQPVAPRLKLTSPKVIGAAAHDMNNPNGWFVNDAGGVVIADRQGRTLHFFDASHKRVAIAGGEGEGPGEFRSISRGGSLHDSTWLWDMTLRRFTVFGPTGKLVRTTSFIPSSYRIADSGYTILGDLVPLAPGSNGNWLIQGTPRDDTGRIGSTRFVLASPAAGSAERIVARLPRSPQGIHVASARGFRYVPFQHDVLHHVSSNGTYLVIAEAREGANVVTIHVTVLDASTGKPRVQRALPMPGTAIPSAAVDSAVRADLARVTDPAERAAVTALRSRVPRYYNPLLNIFAGRDGSVWLQLRSSNRLRRWLVIMPDGTLRGEVTVSRDVYLRDAAGDVAWGVVADADDFSNWCAFRITK